MKRFLIFTLAIFLAYSSTNFATAEESASQPEVSNIFLENPESQEDVEIYLEQPTQEEKYDADITFQEKPHEMINLKLPQSIVSKSLFIVWSLTTGIKSPKYNMSICFFNFSTWELNNIAENISAIKTVNTNSSNFEVVDCKKLVNIKIILSNISLIYRKITKIMIG